MDTLAWTFARGDQERLTIIRQADVSASGVRLIVSIAGTERAFDFSDLMAAVRFQSDMEAFLLKSGWSFIAFDPEHRAGKDRRHFPRLRERRRWWTDGTLTAKQFLGWVDFRWPAEPPRARRKRDRERD